MPNHDEAAQREEQMNVISDIDEHPGGRGPRFYNVVTLGNLISLVPLIAGAIGAVFWTARLEGRVDMEGVLRGQIEKQVAALATESARRNDRVESLLAKINEDVTALRISLGAQPPKRP